LFDLPLFILGIVHLTSIPDKMSGIKTIRTTIPQTRHQPHRSRGEDRRGIRLSDPCVASTPKPCPRAPQPHITGNMGGHSQGILSAFLDEEPCIGIWLLREPQCDLENRLVIFG
jgi:hypothetical protein